MDVELGSSRARESDPSQEHRPVQPARHRRWFPRAKPQATAEDDTAQAQDAAMRLGGGSRVFRALKVTILLVMLAAAGVSAGMAYKLGRASEIHSFNLQFEASVVQLQANFQTKLTTMVKTAEMGAKYISSLPDVGGGRGVHIPGFQALGEDLQNVSGATLSAWIMLVTDAQRPAFEAAAAETAERLDPSGALAAEVRLHGIRTGNISDSRLAAPSFTRSPTAPLYAAVWGYAPRTLPHADYFIFNPYMEPLRRAGMDAVLATNAPSMTDLAPYTFGDKLASTAPSCVVYAPAWPDRHANRTYGVGVSAAAVQDDAATDEGLGRAICSTSFHWATLLASALPTFIDSLVAVLRSPTGVEYTFKVSGREVRGVGSGDQSAQLVGRELVPRGRRIAVTAAGSTWQLELYPTPQLRANYLSAKPRNNAMGISAAVFACALLFFWYEFYDRQRAAAVNARLLAYVRELEAMKRELEEGIAREAEAQATILAAKASAKEKDQFVAMVSHEIRTPLNAVAGATALLAGTALDAEQRDLVALLEAGTAHVVLIVEDILLHGALVSGSFPVRSEPLALAANVLDPAWRMVAMQHAQRAKVATLRVSRTVDADVPPVLMGDATRLTQVLTNLYANSAKFTPAGGSIHLHVSVIAAAASGEPFLSFQVRDSGIGLAAGDIDRVFMPFIQAQQSTVRQYGGTGLGLTICRRIAHALGGDLTATSEGLGKGCTLTFTVPLCVATGEQLAEGPATEDMPAEQPPLPLPPLPASLPPAEPPEAGGVSVLVAEDDKLSQAVMRKVMSRLGLRLTLVGDGAAAVEAYKRERFDAVLMDLHMPIMDGLSATRAICALVARGERPYAPIVALTASCSDEERARCAAAGMVELLPKPISVVKVQELLQRHTSAGAAPHSASSPSAPAARPGGT